MTRLKGEGGFQLVEMLVVVVLLAILGSATSSIVMSTLRAERATDDVRTNLDEARIAVERMRKDVREARRIYATSPEDGLTSGPALLAFWRDHNQDQLQQPNEQVAYRLVAGADGTGELQRRTAVDAAGEWRVIARRLDLSTGSDGLPRSRFEMSPAAPKSVTVTMVLTVQARPEADGQSLTVTETVRLRNAS